MLRVCSSDVLLHGAKALLLAVDHPSADTFPWGPDVGVEKLMRRWVGQRARTPEHRFLQLEPSWFLSGQTTSLFASDAANELVRCARGGMALTASGPRSAGRGLSYTRRSTPSSPPAIRHLDDGWCDQWKDGPASEVSGTVLRAQIKEGKGCVGAWEWCWRQREPSSALKLGSLGGLGRLSIDLGWRIQCR